MKNSYYNFIFPAKNEKWLVYNTFTNGIALIDADLRNKIVKQKFDEIDDSSLKELKKGGFIIAKDINELDLIKIRFRRSQYGNEYLSYTIAPTTNCNMSCKYCFEALDSKVKKVMDNEVKNILVGFIKDHTRKGVKSLFITWFGGEPLLCPEIIEKLSIDFLQLCDNGGVDYSSSIITNGTLLTKSNAEMLKKYKVQKAQITIDGAEKTHNKRRPYSDGSGTFRDIVDNLKEIVGILPIDLRINLDKENIMDIHEFVSFLTNEPWYDSKKIKIYYARVGKTTEFCKCPECDLLNPREFQKKAFELTEYLFEKGNSWNLFPRLALGCGATSLNNFLIGPSGELYKCWNHLGQDSKIVGTIFEDKTEFSSLLIRCLLPGFEKDDECQDCKLLPLCMGGCVDLRMQWEEGKQKSKYCTIWKYNLKDAVNKLYSLKRKRNGYSNFSDIGTD